MRRRQVLFLSRVKRRKKKMELGVVPGLLPQDALVSLPNPVSAKRLLALTI